MIYDYLYDWQKKLITQIKNKRAYGLFLDMGLGKTPLSIALCEQNEVDKILIITINAKAIEDKDVSGSFPYWISKMDDKYTIFNKKSKSFNFNKDNKEALICNYEWLVDRELTDKGVVLRDEIKEFVYGCYNKKVAIILDESHKIKTSKSLQTRAVQKIYSMLSNHSISFLYLLTGTPFTQGYIDLYTQLRLLGMNMNKEQFKDEFCIMDNRPGLLGWQQPIKAYKNLDLLYTLIHDYAITIKSNEVIELPEQTFVYHKYSSTSLFDAFLYEKMPRKDIESIARRLEVKVDVGVGDKKEKINNPFFRNIDYPNFDWVADTPSNFFLRARELSIGFQGNKDQYKIYEKVRFNMVENFLKTNEDNYLIFYSYTPELVELFDICDKLGYNVDVWSGDIKSLTFYEKYSKLSEGERMLNKSKNVILANWASGSTGINLQAYNKCIIFDLPVFRDWEQGIKRIHRIGQKQACIYHIFMQNNFLDRKMLKAIEDQKTYDKDMFESDLKSNQELLNS